MQAGLPDDQKPRDGAVTGDQTNTLQDIYTILLMFFRLPGSAVKYPIYEDKTIFISNITL